MYDLTVSEKTGYRVTDVYKPINIRDERGILFYTTETMLPRVKMFNLPAGNYRVDSGSFKEMENPVPFKLIPLPTPERKFPSPIGFEFKFEPNPHKCTINFIEKKITFDLSFKEMSLPQIYFVLYHEYAHQFFHVEKWADVLASNFMLVKGFNPSQIGYAHITSLSCNQIHRKKFNVKKLIETNGNNS